MKAKWDGEQIVTVTARFEAALHELIEAEMAMMRGTPGHDKECWTWGEATVTDLANASGISLTFGGDAEKPKDMKGTSRVIIA